MAWTKWPGTGGSPDRGSTKTLAEVLGVSGETAAGAATGGLSDGVGGSGTWPMKSWGRQEGSQEGAAGSEPERVPAEGGEQGVVHWLAHTKDRSCRAAAAYT